MTLIIGNGSLQYKGFVRLLIATTLLRALEGEILNHTVFVSSMGVGPILNLLFTLWRMPVFGGSGM